MFELRQPPNFRFVDPVTLEPKSWYSFQPLWKRVILKSWHVPVEYVKACYYVGLWLLKGMPVEKDYPVKFPPQWNTRRYYFFMPFRCAASMAQSRCGQCIYSDDWINYLRKKADASKDQD